MATRPNRTTMYRTRSQKAGGEETSGPKVKRGASLVSSCKSTKKPRYMEKPPHLHSEGGSSDLRTETQRAISPEPSCVSMKSDQSIDLPEKFSSEGGSADLRTKTQRAISPEPSCVSMKSEQSIDLPEKFSSGGGSSESWTKTQRAISPEPSCVSMKSDQSIDLPEKFSSEGGSADLRGQEKTKIPRTMLDHIFKELQQKFISLMKNELNTFKKLLSADYPACSEKEVEDEDDQRVGREGVLKITLHILRNMKQTDLANTLESKMAPACHKKLKSKLRDKCQRINEGISGHGNSTRLNEIYTELYITEGGGGDVNQEHEVKQIEAASRKRATQETPIKCSDIFKSLPEKNCPIRTVLTKGVAGIGKTVSVQKFVLDWAEGKENQDVLFIFPLPFRELNLMKEKKLSLVNLLHCIFPETQDLKPRHFKSYKIILIFDGLDECRLPLDFQNNENLVDIEEQTSVDVLLTNLIRGYLLPSALLWITSRPAAISLIPPECVDLVTEVRGFSDPQKQEYFCKRIKDQDLANKVFTHIRSSRSLYIMCHIPVFCWIAASVLERMLSDAESGEIPKTLTQMFTHFLIFQIKHKSRKYREKSDLDPHQTRESILALGKLAFQQLEKGDLIFYEEDLNRSGIDITEALVYSGVCTQIFREEHELHLGKVFSFVHLSVQEFIVALYVFLCFNDKNVLNQQTTEQQTTELSKLLSRSTMTDFLHGAVDKALQSESGHLDLFLRFLLGLSLESNQTLLRVILTPASRSSHSNEETVKYIKEKIKENASPEKSINLFHCLNELNDHSLVQEVQKYLRRDRERSIHQVSLSPAQWSALVFILLNSEEELDEFDLSKYQPSEECLLRLLPVVKASRRAVLASCNLRERVCETLGSILNLEKSSLKELDLSNNDLQDSGVELLSAGLRSSHCKLETLRLALCNVGVDTCESLGLGLNLENSSLKELDLSNNDLQDSGVELLSAGLKSSHCKLETLRLSGCMVTEKGCSSLAAALSSNPLHLKKLDLTYNHPGRSGVKHLSARLEDPCCKLETLRVEHGGDMRIKPGLKKYACDLTLDPNTANTRLCLSEGNRKVVCVEEEQSYPDHPERFEVWWQVMSRETVSGRCYWEAEWSGWGADVVLTYKTISRKGGGNNCGFGRNENSWRLICCDGRYTAFHNNNGTVLHPPPSNCKRIGVYLDYLAGTLSFYSVSSDTLTHLHTFNTTFTQPLYAGFGVDHASSVCVCEIE
ncbi:NACHT, LRR and PYD domains-containing protein 3-like [Salminus brasiliensis]|uniref:NACHT, LRR and PYD domains-containing protein 3-like n=1 Tax=Salminus brasiliensis TaxID=930266 RepID=UPI003B82FC05